MNVKIIRNPEFTKISQSIEMTEEEYKDFVNKVTDMCYNISLRKIGMGPKLDNVEILEHLVKFNDKEVLLIALQGIDDVTNEGIVRSLSENMFEKKKKKEKKEKEGESKEEYQRREEEESKEEKKYGQE